MDDLEKAIISVVYACHEYFTAQDIQKVLASKHPDLNRGLVERKLRFLRDRGYISQHGPYYAVDLREF